MDIGIGIPNSVTTATGPQLLEWARRADSAGFSTLATVGAVSYPTFEELTLLAAVGAVTERIRLLTDVLIAPARSSAELAKQAATVDQLTCGRLSLGVGIGWRAADYRLTGRPWGDRGRRFDQQLEDLHKAWVGEPLLPGTRPVAPRPFQAGGVPLIIGGMTDAAVRRVVRFGAGWTVGGSPPDAASQMAGKVRAAWRSAGREGQPRLFALARFSLGPTERLSREAVIDYYEAAGHERAQKAADSTLRTPEEIARTVEDYQRMGFDELILRPSVAGLEQVDLLAEVIS